MPQTLFADLARALETMVDTTCASMRGLWLSATVRERRDLAGPIGATPIPMPVGFARWKKARRSKYEALAMFRHAVVWRLVASAWTAELAAGRVYFSPCPDAVPFSHAGQIDGRSAFGRDQLEQVQRELAAMIRAVRARHADVADWTSKEMLVAGSLVERSTRRTLRDTFKMEGGQFDALFDDFVEEGPR